MCGYLVYIICIRYSLFHTFYIILLSLLHYIGLCYLRATSWTIGVLGFGSRRGLGIFLFTTASRKALGPTQTPIQWVPGAVFLGVKWPGREADHSPPSSAEVKESVELYLHSSSTPSWRGARLKKSTGTTLPFLPYWLIHFRNNWRINGETN
jgi:hypothetical protein